MDRKNGTHRGIRQIPVLAGQVIERMRLGLRSPWIVIPVCTFAFTHQPDSQAEEYTWKDGAVLWSNEAASWTVDETLSAWPANILNADALFMTGDETITLGSDVLVNDIELDPNAGNVSISGSPTFVLAGDILPTIEIAAGRSLTVNSTVIADTGFTKTGTGTLTLSSNVSRLADVTVNSGVLQIGSPTATGGNLALRRSDVFVASGASVLSIGSTASANNFALWTGNLSGAGTISTKSATTSTTGALNIALTGNSQFDGTVVASALSVQGVGTQEFTGNVSSINGVNSSVTITTGAGVRLSGIGSNGAFGSAGINLRGGNLVLDNSEGAIGRINGAIALRGGALELIGSSAATAEYTGELNVAGGHSTVSVTPSVVSSSTALIFTTLYQNNDATVDFRSTGTELGTSSRIAFDTTPSMTGNVLRSTANGVQSVGFAIVNGKNFAGYSGTKSAGSVVEIIPTPLTSSGGTSVNALLTSSYQIATSAVGFQLNTLTIDPTEPGQVLEISGEGNIRASAYLLRGTNKDFEIRHSANGGFGGAANDTVRNFHVPEVSSNLTLSATLAPGGTAVAKGGEGILTLNANNTALTKALTINGGIVRAGTNNLPSGPLRLRGGVLEVTQGSGGAGTAADFTRSLGSASGNVNWSSGSTDYGEGGFSAFGGNATVNLGGSATPATLTWNTGSFVPDGGALVLGSARADSRITFLNNIALDSGSSSNYNLRTFRVADNPNSTNDVARLAGNISGSANSDFLKTGAGRLEVTGDNNYTGQTIIHSGELQIGANDGTGAGNGRLSGTERIVVNQSGSLLLGGQNSFTDRISDSTAVSLDGGKLVTDGFSEYSGSAGAIQPGVGSLTLLSDSLIDFGGGASIFAFSDSSHTTWTGTLKIYNYGQGDQLFFGTTSSGLTAAQLARISFYADAGNISLGAPSMRGDGGISVVPEPSSGLTAAALTIFLGSRHRGRRRRS